MSYLTKPQIFTLTLAVFYILTPVDFIPELLTGPFGLFDDAAAFALIIAVLGSARVKAATEKDSRSYVRVDPETGRVI